MKLLRWGRSEYETTADLDLETSLLAAIGVEVVREEGPAPRTDAELVATTSKVRVDEAFLAANPRVKAVITTTSGHDHIDKAACARRGVQVGRCPEARRDAVVDCSIALGLSLLRRIPTLHERARAGDWARGALPALAPRRAVDIRVGVIGHGVIGARVAAAWRALGSEVMVSDPAFSWAEPLDALIEACDLLTLHTDLDGSEALLGAPQLDRMKAGVILVNTARGRSLDLRAAARHPKVGGLGIDVFPKEPWPELAELAARPDTLLMPHAAGYHPRLGEAVARELTASVAAFVAGKPLPYPVRAP